MIFSTKLGAIPLENVLTASSLAQFSQEIVVRHSKKPSGRAVWKPSHRPGAKRGHHGGLNSVLNRLNVLHPNPA